VRVLPSGGRVRAWLRLGLLLRFAGTGTLAATIILALLSGLLPMAFLIAISKATQDLAGAYDSEVIVSGVLARVSTDLVLAFLALACQQMIFPVQEALAVLAGRNIDRHTLTDLLSVSLRAPLERVEEEQAVSTVTEVSDAFMRNAPTPGVAAAALPRLAGRYLQLASAIAVVAVMVSWPVGVLLGVGAVVIRHGQRGSLDKFTREWARLGPARQRMNYFQVFGTDHATTAEIRVLGLLAWLRHRYDSETEAYLKPLWHARRAVLFRPFLVYTAIGFVLSLTAFAALTWVYSSADGVLVLVAGTQAMLLPLRFGVYFPECDVQTQFGMQYKSRIEVYSGMVQRADGALGLRPSITPRMVLPASGGHEIRFVEVRFRYPHTAQDVLCGLNLELEAARSTALVGANGAGKTTVVKLLTSAYPPTDGMILIDGHDLQSVDLRAWRSRVAVIFQNFIRFDLTLADNLRLGAAHLPEDRDAMAYALARANADDIVKALPDGLDTVLSPEYPGGVGLSGGQWQRVALARAFYAVHRGARVLVLDEPTAQLDVRAEIDFYDRFLELTDGLTTLVISHRFSTVRRADKVAVLADERITESGSHDELVAAQGTYAAMFRTQSDRYGESITSWLAT
jgi:ATP-binding cassette, subfamily B, bacterial